MTAPAGSTRTTGVLWRAAQVFCAAVAVLAPGATQAACRLALVLALDVSGSVDNVEYEQQLSGVAEALSDTELASEIYSTSGDWDLIAKFYIDDDVDIGRFVNQHLHHIDGIERTLTTLTYKAF